MQNSELQPYSVRICSRDLAGLKSIGPPACPPTRVGSRPQQDHPACCRSPVLKKSKEFLLQLLLFYRYKHYRTEAKTLYLGCTHHAIEGIKRIFKCHPFKVLGGNHGIDFVPKTDQKESEHG